MLRRTVQRALQLFNSTAGTLDHHRSCRSSSVVVKGNVYVIRKRVICSPERSMRRIASDLGISDGSVTMIVHDELHLRSYRSQKRQALSPLIQRCADAESFASMPLWHTLAFVSKDESYVVWKWSSIFRTDESSIRTFERKFRWKAYFHQVPLRPVSWLLIHHQQRQVSFRFRECWSEDEPLQLSGRGSREVPCSWLNFQFGERPYEFLQNSAPRLHTKRR